MKLINHGPNMYQGNPLEIPFEVSDQEGKRILSDFATSHLFRFERVDDGNTGGVVDDGGVAVEGNEQGTLLDQTTKSDSGRKSKGK